jgi:DNA gyrase subunit A
VVRLAQDFSMRYTLVDGQGNFGSLDGDNPAAMRYTEVRLTKLAEEMIRDDIDKETVDWAPNYDGNETEPLVLPARVPNLLINGAAGIAVGMATNIPPHNLGEVVDALLLMIEDPDVTVRQLMSVLPGPDFPTAGYIHGLDGIRSAYETGRGIIQLRAKTEIETHPKTERQAIIVNEIPYQINKAKLLERIAELVREKRIEGVSDVRDESDRDGIRIVIEVKRDAIAEIILNSLYKMTPMQTTFGIILLAIVNNQPRVMTLREILFHFLNHRKTVVVRRTRYDLRKAEERAHILEGILKALDHLDEVITTIRASQTPAEAKDNLVARFDFTEPQAQAILEMRLQRLTGLEREKVVEEHKELMLTIERLRAILASDQLVLAEIKRELGELKASFRDARHLGRGHDRRRADGDHRHPDGLRQALAAVALSRPGARRQGPHRDAHQGGRFRRPPLRRDGPQLHPGLHPEWPGTLAQSSRDPRSRSGGPGQGDRQPVEPRSVRAAGHHGRGARV